MEVGNNSLLWGDRGGRDNAFKTGTDCQLSNNHFQRRKSDKNQKPLFAHLTLSHYYYTVQRNVYIFTQKQNNLLKFKIGLHLH